MAKSLRIIGGTDAVAKESKNEKWLALLDQAKRALAKAVEFEDKPAHFRPLEAGQPRTFFDEDSIQRLADAISTVGQVYPGIVRRKGRDRYEIVDGERRWRATKLIGVNYKARLVDISDEAVPFLIACIANFNREAHTPLEIADSIERMYDDMGMPIEEVAKLLGISSGWATQMLGLRHLHKDLRKMMDPTLPKEKRLPVTAAVHISKMRHDLQPAMARNVLSKTVTLSGLRTEVVRVSRQIGAHIATRNEEPARKWDGVGRRVNHIQRSVKDLSEALDQPDLERMVRASGRGSDIETVLQSIDTTVSTLGTCKKKLLKARRA